MKICGYDFEGPFDHTNQLKHEQGIYVIACGTTAPDSEYSAIDVGQSGDVRERIENHDRKECWQQHCANDLFVFVLYTLNWTEQQRTQLEGQIRDELEPPCGKR